jgi:hypothetical protein
MLILNHSFQANSSLYWSMEILLISSTIFIIHCSVYRKLHSLGIYL